MQSIVGQMLHQQEIYALGAHPMLGHSNTKQIDLELLPQQHDLHDG